MLQNLVISFQLFSLQCLVSKENCITKNLTINTHIVTSQKKNLTIHTHILTNTTQGHLSINSAVGEATSTVSSFETCEYKWFLS